MIHAGESFTERGREIRTSLPQNLIRKVMLIKARRLISFYDGLRDADERDQADNDQNLYQHRIPQPHNHLLWRDNLIHNPLNRDPTTGNKLIYEHDRGDYQQYMYQVSSYAADQSQQPKHDKQRDNCPQHLLHPPCNFMFRPGSSNLDAR